MPKAGSGHSCSAAFPDAVLQRMQQSKPRQQGAGEVITYVTRSLSG